MHNVKDIANYLIKLANAEVDPDFGVAEGITHLKLQKMLYFVQATFLAIKGEKAFKEKILAWKYGPVIKEIFDKYTTFGSNLLSIDDNFDDATFSEEEKELLQGVWKMFGKYSSTQLVSMTHIHEPRQQTEQLEEISTDSIKDFYTGKIILH